MTSDGKFIHVIGTETEYDIHDTTRSITQSSVVQQLDRTDSHYGVTRSGNFRGRNGSRAYPEVSHKVEYATPECRTGREAMTHEIAGSLFWARMALEADYYFAELGSRDRTHPLIMKTNTSRNGASSGGSHINISMPCHSAVMRTDLSEVAEQLQAFVATLPLITGSGVVLPRDARKPSLLGNEHYRYAISPRAMHISRAIGAANSSTDYGNKPMFMDRDEPLADKLVMWRLQISSLDSNILPSVIEFKLSLLLLMAEMFEAGAIEPIILFSAPAAMPLISLNWRAQLPLADERSSMTALEVQRAYYEMAVAYVAVEGNTHHRELIKKWDELLSAFDTDEDLPSGLYGQVDWVTKGLILRRSDLSRTGGLTAIKAERLHFLYHGFAFATHGHCLPIRIMREFSSTAILARIWRAMVTPPLDTRASARGRFAEFLSLHEPSAGSIDWSTVSLNGRRINFPDPLVASTIDFEDLMNEVA